MQNYKNKIASSLGSVLEWYDFALYGYFAPVLATLFFPSSNEKTSILKIFAVFSVGFIARPLGSLFLGYLGDKFGRITCLKITPLLISIPTFLISILPTYQSAGLAAPLLLIFFRIGQGLCIGGEFSTNIIYLNETASLKKRHFWSSLGASTGSWGMLIASLIATAIYALFSAEEVLIWGWRIPFALSFIFGLMVYLMRQDLQETPVYINMRKNNDQNYTFFQSFKKQWPDYIGILGISFLSSTAFYFVFMFLPNYMTKLLQKTEIGTLTDNSYSLLLRLFIIPIIGLIADKKGALIIQRIACLLFILLSYPLFYILINYPNNQIYIIYSFSLLTTLTAAITPGILVNILKPYFRCTIFSFGFNLSYGVLGGLAPLIGFMLSEKFNNLLAPVYYLIFAAFVSLIFSFLIKKYYSYA